jgi:hypothetical protein
MQKLEANKETDLEINTDETKYMNMIWNWNQQQSHNVTILGCSLLKSVGYKNSNTDFILVIHNFKQYYSEYNHTVKSVKLRAYIKWWFNSCIFSH